MNRIQEDIRDLTKVRKFEGLNWIQGVGKDWTESRKLENIKLNPGSLKRIELNPGSLKRIELNQGRCKGFYWI